MNLNASHDTGANRDDEKDEDNTEKIFTAFDGISEFAYGIFLTAMAIGGKLDQASSTVGRCPLCESLIKLHRTVTTPDRAKLTAFVDRAKIIV